MRWPSDGFLGGIVLIACLVLGFPAIAHHGWSWTEEETFELKGKIVEIYVGNPHATAKAGDEVTAIGNRSKDKAERRMKAVRIIVGGKTYDVYPDRVPSN